MSVKDTGYVLLRKSDGAHIKDGKVRYSTQGANQALWEWVLWRIAGRLQEKHNYDEDKTWGIAHVCRLMKRQKCSLDEANDDLDRYNGGLIPKSYIPVTNAEIRQYADARIEIYEEWEIVKVKVADK